MEIIPVLLVYLICGGICSAIASSKGRSAVGWFFVGFFCSILGIIIICVLSNLKEENARRLYMEQENRRLREQIRQEQIKSESFRSHAQSRLDAHDQHLGIDTRAAGNLLESSGGVAGLIGSSSAPTSAAGSSGWYYAMNGQTYGPVESARMAQMFSAGAIPRTSLVWTEGMADWTSADRIPEFTAVVNL